MNEQQLSRMQLKGFKSIQTMDLDFHMINLLIGSNGSGKSNLISLFSLLQAITEQRLQPYIAKHGGPDVFLHWGRKYTEKLEAVFYFGTQSYHVTLEPTADNHLMFANGNLEETHLAGPLVTQTWRVYHFDDTSDSARVKQIHSIHDNGALATDARNLAAFLYRLKQTSLPYYRRIIHTIRLAAPYFDDFLLRPNPLQPDSIVLEWKAKNSDIPFIGAQLSDGTLRFACLATLLLSPADVLPETIVIDEPELGLHPYAISVLAGLIKKASVTKQLIISTQSVELLNEFTPDDVIVVDHPGTYSTFNRLNTKKLSSWLAEYSLGELWKRNIIGGRP